MPTVVKGPVQRQTCNLCGKDVALLPNGKLRYHSCHSEPGTRLIAEQLPQGYGADANGNPTPRSGAILAQAAPITKEATPMAIATDERVVEPEDESQELPEDQAEGAQEAPEEVTLAGKAVEEATPAKPKREKTPKEPKTPTEPKVPESVQKARAERAALVERAKPIIKITGKGEGAKVTRHLYDTEADRTLCGAVVPAGAEAQNAQGWADADGVTSEVSSKAVSCSTCEARLSKLQAGGSIRRRVSRKPGEAEVGTLVVKAAKGSDQGIVHVTNAASDPLRTLCGAMIGNESEGWTEALAEAQVGCPTCRTRQAKLEAQAETDEAMAESNTGKAD